MYIYFVTIQNHNTTTATMRLWAVECGIVALGCTQQAAGLALGTWRHAAGSRYSLALDRHAFIADMQMPAVAVQQCDSWQCGSWQCR